MIEITNSESEKAYKLYNEIKNIILAKKDKKSFNYNYKQHHLYEESEIPGISKNYYNEDGHVEFKNINGETIRLEIRRWHPHKHNGWSGLNGCPCLNATIYIVENDEKQVLWELIVKSGTLYYKAEVTSLEIPNDILQEYHLNIQNNEEPEISEEKVELENLETRILFDEITNLHNKYQALEQGKEDLLSTREKEIEEAINKINEFYSSKINKNNEEIISTKKELNDFSKLIVKYSSFKIDMLGQALQQLISIIENIEYLYSPVTHKFKKRVHGVMDSWDEDIQTKARIIVKKDKLMNYYDSSEQNVSKINELIKNGDALLLDEQDINTRNNKKITIYTLQDGQIICHVDFDRFNYIKEFIDSIIQYRFQNNITDFTEKDILSLMKIFIIEHESTIIDNYRSKIQEKTLTLKLNN